MRRGLIKLLGVTSLICSLTFSSFGIQNPAIVKADTNELTKILEADDIDIRFPHNDESNIGDAHQVILSDGSIINSKDNGSMRKDLSARYLADNEMGTGINLGNTLEAVLLVDNKKNVTDRTVYDTAWGQPVTTSRYISLLHTYGINTIRIPVAWSNGDFDDGTYKINPLLLDRVEEVVNFALNKGMYVIINDHWDNQWWGQFGACKKNSAGEKVVDKDTRAAAWERYESYWTQIAERFKGYSDHLIFEGANEELGDRLNDGICTNGPAKGYCKPDNAGKDIEVVSGNLKTDELYDTVNKINQTFVDIIRNTGGNNTYRHLLIPGYNTDFTKTNDSKFIMPTDINENGKDKLFLSVHYYTPGDYCLDNPSGDYTVEDQKATTEYFKLLKRFSDEGYGIVIGECSVCNPSSVTSSVTQWLYDTFKECKQYHAVPVLWDNGAYFDREGLKMNYKDIAVFYNTLNDAHGSTAIDRVTGGGSSASIEDFEIPAYLDSKLWTTPGIHAYIMYQTSTWDYRNAYVPIRGLSNNQHSWDYASQSGAELTAENTVVTDVFIAENGTYTVKLDGIDLSGANSFKMLGIATDIDLKKYSNVKVSDVTIKFDGEVKVDNPCSLITKNDNTYYTFMAINVYDADIPVSDYPLGTANENENLGMPTKSMEFTFSISGLDSILKEIEDKTYIDPETGKKISDIPANTDDGSDTPATDTPAPDTTATPSPTPTTPATKTPATVTQTPASVQASAVAPKKGDTFESGGLKYVITDAEKKTVGCMGTVNSNGKSIKITDSVSYENINYFVTSIEANAFKNNKKITKLIIGKNIASIGSKAFYRCKKLSKIIVKSKALKASEIKADSFKKISKKVNVEASKTIKKKITG